MSVEVNKSKDENEKVERTKMRKEKVYQTKVIIRRLPATMTEEQFLEQIAPIPENDYLQFVKADMSLGQHAFSRGYINFTNPDDIFVFKEKFDGYVFLDNKGNEYPAIVEFAPFQKIPKRKTKKRDGKCGTIEQDPDYIKFLESLQNPEQVVLPSAENYLEIIEARERELKANNGVPKITTPLIEYLKQRKLEQQKIREEKREERKRREMEKRRLREEERRRRKAEKDKEKDKCRDKKEGSVEKEMFKEIETLTKLDETNQSETVVVKVLRNPEREKERDKDIRGHSHLSKHKDISSSMILKSSRERDKDRDRDKERDRERGRKEWERQRERERERLRIRERERPRTISLREKPRKDDDYRTYSSETGHTEGTKEKRSSLTQIDNLSERSKYSSRDQMDRTERRSSFDGNRYRSETMDSKKSSYSCSHDRDSRDFDLVGDDDDFLDSKESFSDRRSGEDSKDPRVERRIRNKDRPSLEIYRPGMRRLNNQRSTSSTQKDISTSASNSSTPSPSPTPTNQTFVSAKKVNSEWCRSRSQPVDGSKMSVSNSLQDVTKPKDKESETKASLTDLDKTDDDT